MPGRSPTIVTSQLRHDDVITEAPTLENDSLFNVNEFLNQKNLEFVIASGPTIAFLVVLMTVGIVGNTLVFIVYHKRFKPSVTRTYIQAMTVCDLIINILVIPLQIVEICFSATFDSEWGCKMSRSTSIFMVLFSAALLVAVSVDRKEMICSLRHSLQFSVKAYISIPLCGVASFVLSVPYAVITGKSKRSFVDSNITGVMCDVNDEYTGSASVIVFNATIILAYVLCVVIMSVSYGRIVLQLWRHKKTTARGTPRIADWWVYFKKNRSDTRDRHGLTLEKNVDHADGAILSSHVSSARLLSKEAKHNNKVVNEEQAISISETDITTSLFEPESTVCHVEEPSSVRHAVNEEQTIPIFKTNSTTSLTVPKPTVCHVKEPSSVRHAGNEEQATLSVINTALPQHTQSLNQRLTIQNTMFRGVRSIPSSTSFMLFVLTVIFVVNYLPYLILDMQKQTSSNESKRSFETNWCMIGLRSFYANSALNPLVYGLCSSRFRRECRHLFCCNNIRM